MHKSIIALVGAAGIGVATLAAPRPRAPIVLVAPSAQVFWEVLQPARSSAAPLRMVRRRLRPVTIRRRPRPAMARHRRPRADLARRRLPGLTALRLRPTPN